MRLLRLSLAVKYRILFGLAVLLIIAAALSVPWKRMEALVLEQHFLEAQRIADDYFRMALANPAAAGEMHGQDVALLQDLPTQQPRFIQAPTLSPDESLDTLADIDDEFLGKAMRTFALKQRENVIYTMERGDEGHRFRYVHAVRVTKSCLACHDEGKTARPYVERQLAGLIAVDLPVESIDRQLMFNRLWLIAAGALAGVLAILVFYIITRRFILAPIDELRQVAIRVTDGDLDVRSDLQTGDEFEHLSDQLNAMLARLRESQDELKHANKLLDEKLGEMAETNVALYESNRLKSDFLANVSHELRTPLTSIIGFAELLREGRSSPTDEKSTRYLENILISGRILLEIINDLLDLAKIEAGKVELKLEPVRIDELCGTLVDFTKPVADAKKLWVQFEAEGELPLLITDRGRLRQILFNLLSNAIKFSPEHGRIAIRASRREGDRVRISVKDEGPGVAEADQQMIFEKFRQADQSKTREHQGTGLGLAIAKELTQLLGGEIGVESEPDRGSTFWLLLPTVTSDPADRKPISLV